jgi:hypothetical protein
LNSAELAKQSSFKMILLGTKTADEDYEYYQSLSDEATLDLNENVMGQAVVKMDELKFSLDAYYMVKSVDMVVGNQKVASAMLKMRYHIRT